MAKCLLPNIYPGRLHITLESYYPVKPFLKNTDSVINLKQEATSCVHQSLLALYFFDFFLGYHPRTDKYSEACLIQSPQFSDLIKQVAILERSP